MSPRLSNEEKLRYIRKVIYSCKNEQQLLSVSKWIANNHLFWNSKNVEWMADHFCTMECYLVIEEQLDYLKLEDMNGKKI